MNTTLTLLLLILQTPADPATLKPGVPVKGEITEESERFDAGSFKEEHPDRFLRGNKFKVKVEEGGPYYLELSSYVYDTCLVLRDEGGTILAEDHDGLYGRHSRIVLEELEPDRAYFVLACSRSAGLGPFELHLERGRPPALTGKEQQEWILDDRRRQIAAVEKYEGKESAHLPSLLAFLAIHLNGLGRYQEALQHLERALALSRKINGPEADVTGRIHVEIGTTLQGLNRYPEAEASFLRGVEISRTANGGEHLETSRALTSLGSFYSALGRYGEAFRPMEEALAINEKILGRESGSTASVLNAIGALFYRQGRYEEARKYFEETLAIRTSVLGERDQATVTSLNNLATLYFKLGLYAEARPLYEKAAEIYEAVLGEKHPLTALAQNNLGILLEELRLFPDAEVHIRKALEIRRAIYGDDHPETALLWNNLGTLNQAQGFYEKAVPLFEKALASWEKNLGPSHPQTAKGQNNLASSLEKLGKYERAETLYERSLKTRMGTLGAHHPGTAESHHNLAGLYRKMGRGEEAVGMYRKALEINREILGESHPRTISSLSNLAFLYWDLGRPKLSWQMALEAWPNLKKHLQSVSWSLSEAERFQTRNLGQDLLRLMIQVAASSEESRIAYEAVLSWKGQISRATFLTREAATARLGEKAAGLLGDLQSAQSRLSSLIHQKQAGDFSKHAGKVEEARAERNRLEIELNRLLGPRGAEEDIGFPALQAALPPGSVLLDFLRRPVYFPAGNGPAEGKAEGGWDEDVLSVFITRKDRAEPVRVDLGTASEVEAELRGFLESAVLRERGAFRGGRGLAPPVREFPAAAARLRGRIWDPLRRYLDDVEMIFVSPDSFLGSLPFEILLEEDGTYLIEKHRFVYLQDPHDLTRPIRRSAPSAPGRLLAVGDVDYGNSGWQALPATGVEAKAVLQLHESRSGRKGRGELLLGRAGSEQALKSRMPGCRTIHLATHGFFQGREGGAVHPGSDLDPAVRSAPGLLSGLVCAEVGDPGIRAGEDGVLTAEEVCWLDLSRSDLVVLSACETALGREEAAEGMLGLRRAFRIAGTRTVISSLWSVEDRATRELMDSFYRNLWRKGQGKLEALRNAQLEMLRKNRREHQGRALPSTWGAFVLSGDWR